MTSIDNKKTMRIAMVGVSPADQIAFKGYLRVLLRLDVDLDWVSAQVGEVDLYVVNESFKHSTSVQRLKETHPKTPFLYTSRSTTGEGGVYGDLLVLPLKQIQTLNEWLHTNVAVLRDLPYQKSSSPEVVLDSQPSAHSTTSQDSVAHQSVPVQNKLDGIVEMIKTLNARPTSYFELMQDNEVFALIDGKRQLVWLKSASMVDIHAWRLRVYGGALGEPKHAVDLNQWLYQVAWANSDKLLPLVNHQTRYQLRSWAKPENNTDRRTLLRAMVALEDTARTADEVVARTGLNRLVVQKVIASLLFAQHLNSASYENISVANLASPVLSPALSQPVTTVQEPTSSKTAEQEEKIGFLARLRRKLGL